MTNKYLEKIAEKISDKEVDRHANMATAKGFGGAIVAGTLLPGVGSIPGMIAGHAHQLAKFKERVTGKETNIGKVLPSAAWTTTKSLGRAITESVLGGVAGGAIGAGIGHLAHNRDLGTKIGTAAGIATGYFHGNHASVKNSFHKYNREWSQEKKAALERSLENLTNRSDQLRRAVKNRLDMRSIGLTKKPIPAASASKAVVLGRQTMSKAMSALSHI